MPLLTITQGIRIILCICLKTECHVALSSVEKAVLAYSGECDDAGGVVLEKGSSNHGLVTLPA